MNAGSCTSQMRAIVNLLARIVDKTSLQTTPWFLMKCTIMM